MAVLFKLSMVCWLNVIMFEPLTVLLLYIHSLCPSKVGLYKGYYDANTKLKTVDSMEDENKGINNDSLYTSYKDVEEEATPSPINFGAGEKIKLIVPFLNKRFNLEHIRSLFWTHQLIDRMFIFSGILSAQPHSYARTKIFISQSHIFNLQDTALHLRSVLDDSNHVVDNHATHHQ